MTLTTGFETTESADVRAILLRHFDLMREGSPPESCHVMDPQSLLEAGVVLMGVRDSGTLLAVGGLKALSSQHVELKSMHTISEARGQGIGQLLLNCLLEHAQTAGFAQVSLETGTAGMFQSARKLYQTHGFKECPPFSDYVFDPLSVFMTQTI